MGNHLGQPGCDSDSRTLKNLLEDTPILCSFLLISLMNMYNITKCIHMSAPRTQWRLIAGNRK